MGNWVTWIVTSLLLIFVAACATPTSNNSRPEAKSLTPTCDLFPGATWSAVSLEELAEYCPPSGWEPFFNIPEVREELRLIAETIYADLQQGRSISPPIQFVFRAFYMTKPEEVRAVIVGQDPAPQPGMATGLAFSLYPNVNSSDVASVQRVLLEVQNDGYAVDLSNGDLTEWSSNGVLLLNMALTIPCDQGKNFCTIAGHVPLWSNFTRLLMNYIDSLDQTIAFIFWGSRANNFADTVENERHKVFSGGHPSPQARSDRFFCKGYFKCANNWLIDEGAEAIDWSLPNGQVAENCVWDWVSGERESVCAQTCPETSCSFDET